MDGTPKPRTCLVGGLGAGGDGTGLLSRKVRRSPKKTSDSLGPYSSGPMVDHLM